MGCLRWGSTKGKQQAQKQFKKLYNNTNKHIDCIAPQLLACLADSWDSSDSENEADSDDDMHTTKQTIYHADIDTWSSIVAQDQPEMDYLSRAHAQAEIVDQMFNSSDNLYPHLVVSEKCSINLLCAGILFTRRSSVDRRFMAWEYE